MRNVLLCSLALLAAQAQAAPAWLCVEEVKVLDAASPGSTLQQRLTLRTARDTRVEITAQLDDASERYQADDLARYLSSPAVHNVLSRSDIRKLEAVVGVGLPDWFCLQAAEITSVSAMPMANGEVQRIKLKTAAGQEHSLFAAEGLYRQGARVYLLTTHSSTRLVAP